MEIDNLVQLNKMISSPKNNEPNLRMWRDKQKENEELRNKLLSYENLVEEYKSQLRLEQ